MHVHISDLLLSAALTVLAPSEVAADMIVFDEFGNASQNHFPPENSPPGTFAPIPACTKGVTRNCFETALEPISGKTTLVLHLPFSFVDGDVFVSEPGSDDPSDLLRFENGNDLFVFSEPEEMVLAGAISFADTELADVGVPGASDERQVRVTEVGNEGNNGVTYTPGRNDPGFPDFAVDYVFKSDGKVPEPGSFPLAALGAGALFMWKWLRSGRKDS